MSEGRRHEKQERLALPGARVPEPLPGAPLAHHERDWRDGFARPWRVPGIIHLVLRRLGEEWALQSVAGRLSLWLPVALGLGVLLYFAAPQEPALWACLILFAISAGGAWISRRRPFAFSAMLVLAAISGGITLGAGHTAWIAHDVVIPPDYPVRLTGYVEKVERRVKSDRILLRLDDTPIRGMSTPPALVRLTLRKGTAPPVGSRVRQLAQLLPPLGAAMPGGHDFGRAPWFSGIGAVGFGLGAPVVEPAGSPPFSVRFAMGMDAVRRGLEARIYQSLSGVPAAIALALVSGDRTAIPLEVEDSMRVSGLTHILSISGLHMAMVAGTLFAIIRGGLALFPALALGWPIKSIAAVIALAGSAFYLLLSGNDPPAQRSFIMVAVVLAGVLIGRRALTLRTVSVAAVIMLAFTPSAILGAGTQMSFAATLALVAGYEVFNIARLQPRMTGWSRWLLAVPMLFMLGIAVTTLLAGTASSPYGAYHFQRAATYGLLANLAAMPVVSFLVMPFGLVGVLLIPFGWDGLAWPVMGLGIELMVQISDWVTRLPNADVAVTWMNLGCLMWLTLALLCACLFIGRLRLLALFPLAFAALAAGPLPRPDILVASNGTTIGIRGADGRLSIVDAKRGRLTAEQWLSREGDRRIATSEGLDHAFRCDAEGCVGQLPNGERIAISHQPESLVADCLNANIVVSRHMPPGDCQARVITLEELSRTGTLALFLKPEGWHEVPTRAPSVDRPWLPPVTKEPTPDLSGTWDTGSAEAEAFSE